MTEIFGFEIVHFKLTQATILYLQPGHVYKEL